MQERGDNGPITAVAPNEQVLDEAFDGGLGRPNGPSILIWTVQRVYFLLSYDGAERLGELASATTKGKAKA